MASVSQGHGGNSTACGFAGPWLTQPACVWFQVQVIPWVLADSNFVRSPSQRLDPSKTVFVGALHGMLNAEALAAIMYDLFGGVVYAGIDTDKHKYPIGKCHPQHALRRPQQCPWLGPSVGKTAWGTLGRAGRADVPGNCKVLDHSRAARGF